ncbi:hypothetical protein LX32DRAFT_656438 [Colletotrichum zoysiae]|uniref:Uncharacterized protein n=1 Tax=Colletotrichum zoysiae TaxID=1216348 RepID=A0AAD9LX80_9PEZI|nr:hypothetical protein LX32DRAFT_656438 [Colletotrichum zoysiae]
MFPQQAACWLSVKEHSQAKQKSCYPATSNNNSDNIYNSDNMGREEGQEAVPMAAAPATVEHGGPVYQACSRGVMSGSQVSGIRRHIEIDPRFNKQLVEEQRPTEQLRRLFLEAAAERRARAPSRPSDSSRPPFIGTNHLLCQSFDRPTCTTSIKVQKKPAETAKLLKVIIHYDSMDNPAKGLVSYGFTIAQ